MSEVFMHSEKDAGMQKAAEQARATFRYFWREICWERQRIIPGLDVACVKIPFFDPPGTKLPPGAPEAEQMWVDEVDFDGDSVTGVLVNSPNWLQSVKEGDKVKVPLKQITDWMYSIADEVFGAFTVNRIRSQMNKSELAQHDAAWGLNFGDPNSPRVVPMEWFTKKAGFMGKLFTGGPKQLSIEELDQLEHPMALNMTESLEKFLKEDPENVGLSDDNGVTIIHRLAMAGSPKGVEVALRNGADLNRRTKAGKTPLQLAQILGWKNVVDLLRSKGATA